MRRWFFAAAVLMVAVSAVPSSAQSRGELLEEALSSVDPQARLNLLIRALDPALGVPDSTWAIGAFSMTYRLAEAGRGEEAGHWMRWAAREGYGLGMTPADFPALFPPPIAAAYEDARTHVEAEASFLDVAVKSSWLWPVDYTIGARGALTVIVEGVAGVRAEIEGVGPVSMGETVLLESGAYRLVISGDDIDPITVVREVLPGVVRAVTVSFAPSPAGLPLPMSARR